MNRLLSDLCDIWFICSCSHCGNSLSVNGLTPSVAYSIPWELLRVRDGGGVEDIANATGQIFLSHQKRDHPDRYKGIHRPRSQAKAPTSSKPHPCPYQVSRGWQLADRCIMPTNRR